MNDYPLSTWVTVDDVKIPCHADDLYSGVPTVLDGLSLTWGRESTVDQPDTETCSFTIREQLNPAVKLAPSGIDLFPNPGMETGTTPINATPTSGVGTNAVDRSRMHGGAQSVVITNTNTINGTLNFAVVPGTPAQLSPDLKVGDQIEIAGWVYIPSGATPGSTIFRVVGSAFVEAAISLPTPPQRDQWVRVSVMRTLANLTSSTSFYIYGTNAPLDQTWWDDLTIYKWEDQTPPTTLDQIHVGSEIEVWSQAEMPPTQTETMINTGFPTQGPLDPMLWSFVSGEQPTITVARFPHIPQNTAQITRSTDFDWTAITAFPPSPFQVSPAAPDAWDQIPRLLPGQKAIFTTTVWLPKGVIANLKAYAYTAPYKTGATACVIGAAPTYPNTITGTAAWVTLSATVTLPARFNQNGAWIAGAIELVHMPMSQTWAQTPGIWTDQTLRWMDLNSAYVKYLSVTYNGPSIRSVLVWSGQVTSLVAQAVGDKAFTTTVTASDISASLANLKVGDVPWPVEGVQTRARHILDRVPTAPPITIDAALQPIQVSRRDVDAQPPLGLLQDLAQTAGGTMWVTSHATKGVYLWMEDIDNRAAVSRFVIDPGTGLVTIGGNVEQVALISAWDILQEPISWTQDTSHIITQVGVGWLEQTVVDGQPDTAEHTEIVQADQTTLDKYGIRDMSVSTELINAGDAITLANRLLALSQITGWLATGLQLDTILLERDIPEPSYTDRLNVILTLLDATTRIGAAVTLIELPVWTPEDSVSSMYIEGGTYTWENYRWQLDLTASPAAAQGESATWNDFATTNATWDDFDTSITWQDAYGTAGPA